MLTGISKGHFESKHIVESRPLVAVLLCKRKKERKHEMKNPLQTLSQDTVTTTQRAEAQPVPSPAHPPTRSHHPSTSLQISQHHFVCLNGHCTRANRHLCCPGANALPSLVLPLPAQQPAENNAHFSGMLLGYLVEHSLKRRLKLPLAKKISYLGPGMFQYVLGRHSIRKDSP